MKNKEDFEKLTSDLTELEMADLLDVCSGMIDRNKWGGLLDQIFNDSDKAEDLEYSLSKSLEREEELESELEECKSSANKALECLIKGEIEKAKQTLSEI